MKIKNIGKRILLTIALLLSMFTISVGVLPVRAQSAPVSITHVHKKNWIQRHPTATALAAAAITHHMLKVRAARDKAEGKKLTWAERHPTLSAIGAGIVTHHVIKATTPKE